LLGFASASEDQVTSPAVVALESGVVFQRRYRTVRSLSSGGMGSVYEVHDETTSGMRALKLMHPMYVENADLRRRFELEAKITGGLESDHIVRVFDAGVDEATGVPFIVMELLRGMDLGTLLEKRGPLSPADVVVYLSQAALALEKTHAAGIVHRDLKPDNMVLTQRDDGSPCLKILDFGIAKLVDHGSHPSATQTMGTPLYMAPEQIHGEAKIGPRTDVFALGHIAYTLLAGEAYYTEQFEQTQAIYTFFSKVLEGSKEAPSARAGRRSGVTLPGLFDGWFAMATALSPQRRFEGARAAVEALAAALDVPVPRRAMASLPEDRSQGVPERVAGNAFAAETPSADAVSGSPVVAAPRPAPGGRKSLGAVLGMAALALLLGMGVVLVAVRGLSGSPSPSGSGAESGTPAASSSSGGTQAPAVTALPTAPASSDLPDVSPVATSIQTPASHATASAAIAPSAHGSVAGTAAASSASAAPKPSTSAAASNSASPATKPSASAPVSPGHGLF
jgi:hypothetical protein